MRFLCKLTKNYPVSCFYVLIIWVLCFMPVPQTPISEVPFADKWTHFAMYGGTCGTIWYEYLRRHTHISWPHILAGAWLAPVLMSGLIELLQAYCTGGRRSGDWLDFAANAVGATIGLLIGILLVAYRARRSRGE